MTNAELDTIESALGVRLPVAYRRLSVTFPFKPLDPARSGTTDWFYNDAATVIAATRAARSNQNIQDEIGRTALVVIGDSGAGDWYVIDTTETPESALPVYCISHEDHQWSQEWPTLAAFTAEWLQAPAEYARHKASDEAAQRAWWKRAWKIGAVVGFLSILLPLFLLLGIHFFAPQP